MTAIDYLNVLLLAVLAGAGAGCLTFLAMFRKLLAHMNRVEAALKSSSAAMNRTMGKRLSGVSGTHRDPPEAA